VKLLAWDAIIDNGFSTTDEFRHVERDIKDGIGRITWPPGSDTFTILPERKANGVKPIKEAFVAHLKDRDWVPERNRFDAHYTFPHGDTKPVVVEWKLAIYPRHTVRLTGWPWEC
jgi:hypothetical protein